MPSVDGTRILFHVDMDAFYASVHARDDPRLAHVPLVVGADPRGGKGRGVVSTCNYPARQFGIRSAMPINEAYRRCPEAVFLRPDFQLYKPASEHVMDILGRYADVLQVVGMDEAYLDVTQRCVDWAHARSLARSLQAAIKRETGLSASIGIGPNKSIAKIASDYRKPHGITLVTDQDALAFLAPLSVRLINGCGPKTATRLEEWEIRTIGDLAAMDRDTLHDRFGSHGLWLHDIANGIDPREVSDRRGPGKSRGNERTYFRDETDPEKVVEHVQRLVDGLLDGKDRRAFSTITVKLRTNDWDTRTRAHTAPVPLDPDTPETRRVAHATIDTLLRPLLDGRPVRLAGVRLSGFSDATGQRGLGEYGIDAPAVRIRPQRPSRPSRGPRATVLAGFHRQHASRF